MFRHLWMFAALFCFTLASYANPQPLFQDTQGHLAPLTHLKNQWVIINYWASWCASCLKEIPELNRFYQNHQHENVLLYGVNYDQLPLDNLRTSVADAHIKFPVLADDPNALWQIGDIEVLPATFIINPEGRVVKKLVGPNTEASLLDTLHELQAS